MDKEDIYKDLIYTQNAYFLGEQVYPNWESIYALIISGFFIVYFSAAGITGFSKLILCFLGILFSFNWFCLVSRNHLYVKIRAERMRQLENALQQQILNNPPNTQGELKLFSLSTVQEEKLPHLENFWSKRGTWLLRKAIPKYLLIVWLVLLLHTIFGLTKCFFS